MSETQLHEREGNAEQTPQTLASEKSAGIELPIKLDVSHLITEDDTPMDNFLSEKNQRLLTEPLYSARPSGLTSDKFIVAANVGVFNLLFQQAIVPDVEMPESWEAKEHRSYMIWEFGKPPEVVIEIVSHTPGKEDSDKLKRYERIGVDYYVVFDPYRYLNDNLLTVYERRSGRLQPMNRPWLFSSVGIGVMLWNGVYEGQRGLWLRWCDREGVPIPTGAELAQQERQRAEQERQRAEQEKGRAEQERQRAEQESAARSAAEAELARLRAELARLQQNK
jgi:Uma2 family endonuclease